MTKAAEHQRLGVKWFLERLAEGGEDTMTENATFLWAVPSNQNADPDVRKDMETFLSKVAVPECSLHGAKAPWVHTDEGDDDMPAHVKSSMFGSSLTIPITNGRLNLGMWQGIWLCEHRDRASGRSIVVTLQGE